MPRQSFYEHFSRIPHEMAALVGKPVDPALLRTSLRDAERLISLGERLEKLAVWKRQQPDRSRAIDRLAAESLSEGVQSLDRLADAVLGTLRDLRAVNILDQLHNTFTTALQEEQSLSLREFWADGVNELVSGRAATELRKEGVDPQRFEKLLRVLPSPEAKITLAGEDILFSERGNNRHDILVQPSGLTRTVHELMMGDQFDYVAEMFRRRTVSATVLPEEQSHTARVKLLDPLAIHFLVIRNAMLEDLETITMQGLPTRTGQDPLAGIIIALIITAAIAGAVALAGSVILILCTTDTLSGDVCTVGLWLTILGIFVSVSAIVCIVSGCTITIGVTTGGLNVPLVSIELIR